jgi:hypothetical protein
MRIQPLSILVAISLVASAQQAPKKQPTSTVTGHIYCADTNAPARMASVMLEPVRLVEKAGTVTGPGSSNAQIVMTAVETGLDGSFAIQKVSPGTYYVIAYKSGYLSPLATFPSDVLSHPSEEDRKRIDATVPKITVEAGLPASIDLRLERGAAISGTILFDDGTPAADLAVRALVRNKQGQKDTWSPLRATPFAMSAEARTDDLGRYRIAGLAPREYTVQVDLELLEREFGVTVGGEGTSMMYRPPLARIAFFSGSTSHKREAAPFKLGAGEERTGEDITIPLSKLHTISGELLAAHDGHTLTRANIQLLDADDKSEMETTRLGRADNKFHLFFVPEGNYILHIDDTADVTYEDVPFPPGTMPPSHEETHVLRIYGTLDQQLTVHDDIPGLTISVPDKTAPQSTPGAAAQ